MQNHAPFTKCRILSIPAGDPSGSARCFAEYNERQTPAHPSHPDPGGERGRPGDFEARRQRPDRTRLRDPPPVLLSQVGDVRCAAQHDLLLAAPARKSMGVIAISVAARTADQAGSAGRGSYVTAL